MLLPEVLSGLLQNLGFRDLGIFAKCGFPILATLTDIEYAIYMRQ
jgi:hypothetical protein